jgi:outer membrane protein assembly factor BamE (lipoprotein component of BamABCDE complex)
MLSVSTERFVKALLMLVASILAPAALPSVTRAQDSVQTLAQHTQVEEPRYRAYRGVRLGMTEAEVHSALGTPKESDGRQEFYAVSDAEMAQVFYDVRRNVWAVNVSYLGGQGKAPTPEQIFGGPVEAKPDGSFYKMVKYERAGYYVAYSRDAGDAPFVTVVMQKLPD